MSLSYIFSKYCQDKIYTQPKIQKKTLGKKNAQKLLYILPFYYKPPPIPPIRVTCIHF